LLDRLVSEHGAPAFLRSDNGPEFIALAVKGWLAKSGIATDYIEPGSPWENSHTESFNSRFRDELLNMEIFTTLLEARVLIEEHRQHYNHDRVHSSLEYRTPTEFAAHLRRGGEPKASAGEKAKPTAAGPRPLISTDSHSSWYKNRGQVTNSASVLMSAVESRTRNAVD